MLQFCNNLTILQIVIESLDHSLSCSESSDHETNNPSCSREYKQDVETSENLAHTFSKSDSESESNVHQLIAHSKKRALETKKTVISFYNTFLGFIL